MWHGRGAQRDEDVTIGFFRLVGNALEFETNSAERGERGRRLIEEHAGGAVRYVTTELQDMASLVANAKETAEPARQLPDDVAEALRRGALDKMRDHYLAWPDEPVPALDGHTPRDAARSAELLPKLVVLLKGFETHYERALATDVPAFDPTWMWQELGLEGEADAPARRKHAPLLAHESVAAQVAGFSELAAQIATRIRSSAGYDATRAIDDDELEADLGFIRHLREAGPHDAPMAASWLRTLCNFELHYRKAFWVDEELAWMLSATQLDLTGDELKLPFASYALIFTDRLALGVAERVVAADREARLRGRMLQVVTAYVTEVPAGEGARGLRITLASDALDGGWPHAVFRDLHVRPQDSLDGVIASHFPDVDPGALDPVFTCAPLRELLQLVLAATVYATSADAHPEKRSAPARSATPANDSTRRVLTSEDVFYLPGKIEISSLRHVQRSRRGGYDRTVVHQCMVRGHWRRPNASWEDQRVRWVQPYWRGPKSAAVVERQYLLKP